MSNNTLLRNIDPSNGLCDGTRMKCKHFEKNITHVEIIAGEYIDKQVLFYVISLSPDEVLENTWIF